MGLQFERGNAQEPRGHAILYARVSGSERYVATYCIVLPISFSMAKYLPPMLSGQLGGMEAMSEGMSVVPIPPMLEDVPDLARTCVSRPSAATTTSATWGPSRWATTASA